MLALMGWLNTAMKLVRVDFHDYHISSTGVLSPVSDDGHVFKLEAEGQPFAKP